MTQPPDNDPALPAAKDRASDPGGIAERVQALLSEMAELLSLAGESVFKVRAFEKAAEGLAGRTDLEERAQAGTLTELEGVGKGIGEVLEDFLLRGSTAGRDQLRSGLPAGLPELARIPGLGPKKARKIIEALDIHSVGELEYACRENRLLGIPGFGIKLQARILEAIRFAQAQAGKLRLDQAETLARRVLDSVCTPSALQPAVEDSKRREQGSGESESEGREKCDESGRRIAVVGALRRCAEVVSALELQVEGSAKDAAALERRVKDLVQIQGGGLQVTVSHAESREWGSALARNTATDAHWKALGSPDSAVAATEQEFYRSLGLPWIAPELRETGEEVTLARRGALDGIITGKKLRGIFHNHTDRSDGSATLEEMVVAAKRLGLEYLGISDHSQSAFYARGLQPDSLLEQEREIRELRLRHPEIRIFWGIESDILADGSLDYDDATLARFDFVVASIHSRFRMDRQAMTDRILAAIRHPATRFLGHPTGRILLGRPGYEVDLERIIQEAVRHDVAIELNAHPARLDIDWRWGKVLREAGARVAINPDAHSTEELENTRYGLLMARKALLPASAVVNTLSAEEVGGWLSRNWPALL
jgi:DNA polymerase (family 10)